jgi:hypothetical protein
MVQLLKKLLFFFWIVTFSAVARDLYVAEGEFWAAEDDSSRFIKEQLKTNALKNALNNFFTQMELNSSVFWQLVDRKISSDLEGHKNVIDKKIEIAREAQKFEEVLRLETKWRQRRLNYFTKFLESKRLYISFSASAITSSMVNPQLKMSRFKVSLNRNMVKKMYFEITKSDSNRHFQNLLISFRIDIPRESFSQELNESISLVKKAVTEKWISWLEVEYKDIFNNFIIASESQERQLSKYIFSPPGSVNLVDMSMVKNVERENELILSDVDGAEEGDQKDPSLPSVGQTEDVVFDKNKMQASENEMNTFKDSQWLQVKVRLSSLEEDKNFKRIKLSMSGGHLFFDLNSREIILSDDYIEESNIYSVTNLDSFSSSIGTGIYNLPLNGFRTGKKVFTKAPQINNQAQITVLNLKKPEQIIGLSDFLNLGGDSVNLKVSSFDIIEQGAKITLNYFGEIDNLKNKFLEWENKKVLPNKRWHFYADKGELFAELLPDVIEVGSQSSLEEKTQ